ncbi:MAG: tetratricopeptide repeat protein [Candidatus Kapabacteria bacterium]|nr:tetratricopeptide repeat protein [Candidatus Kapabacteria bacterium]
MPVVPHKYGLVVIILYLALGIGCRSLTSRHPTQHVPSPNKPPSHKAALSARSDSTENEPQRLLPLRTYVDEIARRQSSIEQRLDSLSKEISSIRSVIDRVTRGQSSDTSMHFVSSDSIIAGVSGSGAYQDNKQANKAIGISSSKAAIIYPDQSSIAVPSLEQKSNAKRRSKQTHRVGDKQKQKEGPPASPSASKTLNTAQPSRNVRDESRLLDSTMMLLRNMRYDQAERVLNTLIEYPSPQRGEYLYLRALVYYFQNKYQAAAIDGEAAWKLLQQTNSPRRADLLYLLAELYEKEGNTERARESLRTLLERFPLSEVAILARRKIQQLAIVK